MYTFYIYRLQSNFWWQQWWQHDKIEQVRGEIYLTQSLGDASSVQQQQQHSATGGEIGQQHCQVNYEQKRQHQQSVLPCEGSGKLTETIT